MWVVGGSRTGDEMTHNWLAVTHLDEEGYEELVAQRMLADADTD
jgi:glutamate/tyrosine decarboxylase-like PLP-dependent enzyme